MMTFLLALLPCHGLPPVLREGWCLLRIGYPAVGGRRGKRREGRGEDRAEVHWSSIIPPPTPERKG